MFLLLYINQYGISNTMYIGTASTKRVCKLHYPIIHQTHPLLYTLLQGVIYIVSKYFA